MEDYEIIDIKTNQPQWQKAWLEHTKVFKLRYVKAPQELRIDPTFCPLCRRRDWDFFKRYATGIQSTWLNYPLLAALEGRKAPTEKYVIETLEHNLKRLDKVSDLNCAMLNKIYRMLITVLTAFKKLPSAGPHWTTYFEGPDGMAWSLQEAPSKEILMGIYARCIYLSSHYMQTFEEAFYTGFFKVQSNIFSLTNTNPLSRYIAFRTMEVDHPLEDVAAEAERKARQAEFRRALPQHRREKQ